MNRFFDLRCSKPFRAIIATAGVMLLLSPALASDPIRSLSQRFEPNASGVCETSEVPDFQKHISPLLGRLGCNGRACHGSFQGQGGFMLSLFGYDFDLDHKALLEDDADRVSVESPLESLILTKPVDADMHEGGERFKENSWEYWVLRKWIEAGAPKAGGTQKSNVQKLLKLDVSPLEIQFDAKGNTEQLLAIAVWEDGTQEDVTGLCRFFSNDTAIAQIDETGIVTGGESGDTHVVVAYDNAVVPVSVLRPVGKPGQLKQEIANAKNEIDRLVLKKLDKLGIQPSGDASDAEFFRRASLDVAGTLPTSTQVREFLADTSVDKRERMIESLLESPGYAAWWTTFLCDLTGNNDDQLRNFSPLPDQSSQHWYQWIYERVAKNVPYDEIVEGIVTAVSREPDESYREYCENMTRISGDDTGKSFADRSSMMYYWARNNQRTAEERAISFAYAFCGVRIQCAQCHKHPFDQWSKQDFDQFERLFDGLQANQNSYMPDSKEDVEKIISDLGLSKSLKGNELRRKLQEIVKSDRDKTIPFPELYVRLSKQPTKEKKDKKDNSAGSSKMPTARLLGSDYVDLSSVSDPREPLMEWLRRKDNPYFAKAIVNRVWAHYFQVGIVNPADDHNLANAPSNAELLDYLASQFVENGYDLKWLHRTILNTATYQRTWHTNSTNELDRRNFSHALLRRLPAETAYDALRIAVSSDKQAHSMCNLETERAMTLAGSSARSNNANGNRNGTSSYALSVFGRSIRESNCDCDKTSDPSLLQTVFIRNDADVLKAMSDPKTSWLSQIAKEYHLSPELAAIPKAERQQSEKEKRIGEELDRKVRTYRKQLEKLTQSDGNEKAIRDAKSRLALYQKRYDEFLASSKKSSPDPLKTSAAETLSKVSESRGSLSKANETSLIEEAYLRTLSRMPSASELEKSRMAIASAESPLNGISDVLWALINSKEFILNH